MAVPSWVYDDNLSDEEKLQRFHKDMRFNMIMFATMIPSGLILGFILKATGVV